MIDVSSKLLALLKESSCFGIAHDSTVPECQKCDVQAQCMRKMEGEMVAPPTSKPKAKTTPAPAEPKPKASKPKTDKPKTDKVAAEKPKAAAKKTEPKKAKATTAVASADMPDFKPMSLEALKELAAERKVDWKDYGNDNITRMRLIMALRASYQ